MSLPIDLNLLSLLLVKKHNIEINNMFSNSDFEDFYLMNSHISNDIFYADIY